MKKLKPLIGLTLSLAVAGIIMGFTLSGGSGAPAQDPAGQTEEPSGNRPPIRSDEGIDPNVCNLIHNLDACTAEELGELGNGPLHGDPTYDEWLSDFLFPEEGMSGVDLIIPGISYDEWLSDFGGGKVVTSIDDIDPNICNAIHNINACSPQELEELGMPLTTGSITVGEYHPGGEVEGPGGAVEGKPEGAVEVKPESDCGLTELSVYLSADGEFGCVVVHDFEEGGESEIKEQLPVMMPQVAALLVQ